MMAMSCVPLREAGSDLVERLQLASSSPLQQHEAAGVGVAARAVMAQQPA